MRRTNRSTDKIPRECPRERDALAAVLAGSAPAELERHVAECEDCREVVAVSTWLRGVAREFAPEGLPRADRVWWRAQVDRRLQGRRALAERAARPIRWFERGAAAAIAVALAWVLRAYALDPADAALATLSDPAALGALTAGLMTVAWLAAREAVRRP
jgi:hypothetical protein